MNQLKEIKYMAQNGDIQDLRMEPASNGVIICYTKKVKNPGKGTYDNYQYNYEKEVFDLDKDDENEMDKAWARFKELWKQSV